MVNDPLPRGTPCCIYRENVEAYTYVTAFSFQELEEGDGCCCTTFRYQSCCYVS